VGGAVSGERAWAEFAAAEPALAAAGERLMYQGNAIAGAFLATVAPDGGPRLHPVSPVLAGGDLWLFIVSMSPKYRDLVRNGRYALHSLPLAGGGEEFHLRGGATAVEDRAEKERIAAATGGRLGSHDFEALFRCTVGSALHVRWENWGTAAAWPAYAKWRA
jgi:hypothetical protein